MNGVAQRPDTASTRGKLALPRWLLLLLAMTVWPLLVFLFHGLLPWVLSGMARRVGWVEHRPGYWNWAGLGLAGLGGIGLLWFWFVHIRQVSVLKSAELKSTPDYLITGGPYRYSRNPAYVAAVTLWLGWTIFYGSWLLLVGTLLLWLILNHIVIPREERGLESRHQEAYRQYFREVRRWL
jgi:protein-S-isoprenylcysteine O-methyltransferase Ste14